jgi:hypothetical protein
MWLKKPVTLDIVGFGNRWLAWSGHKDRLMHCKIDCSHRVEFERGRFAAMLKESNDGLSKVWKVHKSNDPFCSGGKVRTNCAL